LGARRPARPHERTDESRLAAFTLSRAAVGPRYIDRICSED
jgi:hypothetical protein